MKEFFIALITTWWGILSLTIFCLIIWIFLSAIFYKIFFKRFYDLLLSIIALPFFLLLLIPIAIAIKCEDKGPIFYCGKRIGKKGKPFKMIKFRSMKVNAPDIRLADGSTYNGEDDPRVTKMGRFLRKTSLDEIPQILNILVGQMSIIGPRPDPVDWFDRYTDEQKFFLKARPGISGYSQAYFRNSVDGQEKINNDIYYVKNISLWFDIKIFFRTLFSVFKRENIFVETMRAEEVIIKDENEEDTDNRRE